MVEGEVHSFGSPCCSCRMHDKKILKDPPVGLFQLRTPRGRAPTAAIPSIVVQLRVPRRVRLIQCPIMAKEPGGKTPQPMN